MFVKQYEKEESNMQFRKLLLPILFAAGILFLAAACGKEGPDAPGPDDPQEETDPQTEPDDPTRMDILFRTPDSHNIAMSYLGNREYQLDVDGNDPFIFSARLFTAVSMDQVLLEFDYKSTYDIDNLQIYYALGGSASEESTQRYGKLPATDTYKHFQADILPFLPVLQSLKGSGEQFLVDTRIEKLLVDDYYTTLNDLYLRDHVGRLTAWTHTFGYKYRAQSYGGDVNTAAASCVLDVAEGESLGFGEMREFFRNISGGVHIGEGCVIGAGSVVTRDIPAHCFAAGNPCRVIRKLSEKDSIYLKQGLFPEE